MAAAPELVHATAIALGDDAVLICGPSGSGKSDLALRCIAQPANVLWRQTAMLVSDDQVVLVLSDGLLHASAPATIRGKLEVRGLGIVELPARGAVVRLVAELVTPGDIERLPDNRHCRNLLGVDVPVVRVSAFAASAPIKVLLALARHAELFTRRL